MRKCPFAGPLAEKRRKEGESSAGTVWSTVDTEDLHMFVFDLRAAARKGAGEDTEREKFTEEVSRGGDRGWGQRHTHMGGLVLEEAGHIFL